MLFPLARSHGYPLTNFSIVLLFCNYKIISSLSGQCQNHVDDTVHWPICWPFIIWNECFIWDPRNLYFARVRENLVTFIHQFICVDVKHRDWKRWCFSRERGTWLSSSILVDFYCLVCCNSSLVPIEILLATWKTTMFMFTSVTDSKFNKARNMINWDLFSSKLHSTTSYLKQTEDPQPHTCIRFQINTTFLPSLLAQHDFFPPLVLRV